VRAALRHHANSIFGKAHRALATALDRIQHCALILLDSRRDVAQHETVDSRAPGKLTEGVWRRMQRVQNRGRAGRIEDQAIEHQQVASLGDGAQPW